ncbi:MAG: hypothetical protein A2Y12_07765 [Planctomycetes bacterium GWF2_42_9]|nr:MAG: hypothetical protein A2Y12_07765 [Planctomycetes bacterium GWF2_42_9]
MQQDENYPAGHQGSAAQQVQTTPVNKGGASFCTHRLVEISPDVIKFKVAAGAIIFSLAFLFAGMVAATVCIHNLSSGKTPIFSIFSAGIIVPGLACIIAVIASGGMLYFWTSPIVFDKRNGYFWKGRKSPDNVYNIDQTKTCTKLEKIKTIQLLSEHCTSKDSSYVSYEINLVLDDGKRINVVDHGKLTRIRSDAEKLSAFLGKPVMDLMLR